MSGIDHADDLLSVGKAARYVGVSTETLRRWANAGSVPVKRLPTDHRRFRRGDLEPLRAQQEALAHGRTPDPDEASEAQRIGHRVRTALALAGKSQADVGQLLGLNVAAVSRRITGAVCFRADELLEIGENLLQIAPESFLASGQIAQQPSPPSPPSAPPTKTEPMPQVPPSCGYAQCRELIAQVLAAKPRAGDLVGLAQAAAALAVAEEIKHLRTALQASPR